MTYSAHPTSAARLRLSSLTLTPDKAAAALYLGFVAALAGAVIGPLEAALAGTVLAFGLAWASMVDIDRFILPDVLTLGLTFAGLGWALAGGAADALPYAIGAAAGYGALALLAASYQRLRGRSGLGMGDAKLLAAGGAWLGWMALPVVVLLASLACLVFVVGHAALRGQRVTAAPIPFGPYLAAAIWILWLVRLGGGL
ncbi:MAG: A24 family peptidase [Hyphomonadaceae bacterium]|nr:A24 family peptidase [Hyphomonadaceae bacterium]